MSSKSIWKSINDRSILASERIQNPPPLSQTMFHQQICPLNPVHQYGQLMMKYYDEETIAYDQAIPMAHVERSSNYQFELRNDLLLCCPSIHQHQIFRINREHYESIESFDDINEYCCLVTRSDLGVDTSDEHRASFCSRYAIRCQWYPWDQGLYGVLSPCQFNIWDTEHQRRIICLSRNYTSINFHYANEHDHSRVNFTSMDWNVHNQRLIAFSCPKQTIQVFDIRTALRSINFELNQSNQSLINNQSIKNQSKITAIHWAPIINEHCLLIGDSNGTILLYDVRHTTRSVTSHQDGHLFRFPVLHLQITPNGKHLLTIHAAFKRILLSCWSMFPGHQDQDNQAKFLEEVPCHPHRSLESSNYRLSSEISSHMQPFLTNDYVLFPGKRIHTEMIFCPIYKTRSQYQNSSKHATYPVLMQTNEKYRMAKQPEARPTSTSGKIQCPQVYGYGGTVHGDEPYPALFYYANDVLIVRRQISPQTIIQHNQIKNKFIVKS